MSHSEPGTSRTGPAVDRVPARTRAPLIAIALALAFVGVLIVKPWDVAVPSGSAISSVAGASPGESATAVATATPSEPLAGASIPARGLIYTIEIPDEPVRCIYQRVNRKHRWLMELVVPPPRVYVTSDAGTGHGRTVGWRVEVQSNRQETLFNAEWDVVAESRLEAARAVDGRPAPFDAMSVANDWGPLGRTAVIRARILVDWYSPRLDEVDRHELVLPVYIEGARATGPEVAACSAVL